MVGMVTRLATGVAGFNDQKYHRKMERRIVYTKDEPFIVEPNNHREFMVNVPQTISIEGVVPTSCHWPQNIRVEHLIQVFPFFELFHLTFDFKLNFYSSLMIADCVLSMSIPIIVEPPEIKATQHQVPEIRISMDGNNLEHLQPIREDLRRSNSWNTFSETPHSLNYLISVCPEKYSF